MRYLIKNRTHQRQQANKQKIKIQNYKSTSRNQFRQKWLKWQFEIVRFFNILQHTTTTKKKPHNNQSSHTAQASDLRANPPISPEHHEEQQKTGQPRRQERECVRPIVHNLANKRKIYALQRTRQRERRRRPRPTEPAPPEVLPGRTCDLWWVSVWRCLCPNDDHHRDCHSYRIIFRATIQ